MGSFQGRGTAAGLGVLMMLIMSFCVNELVLAVNYSVGDGKWTIMSYDSWLAGKTFKVGDTVEFVYTSAHDVVEVSEADYASCSAGSNTVNTNGDTTYTLNSTGTKYFLCSVPTHCESGMKIAIPVVAAAATTPTTSPTTSPTPTTPSTSPSTTPPTTPSSSTNSTPASISPRPLFHSSLFFPASLLSLGLSILFFSS